MQHLAAKGWVCVAINYRLAPRDPFPAQIVDVKKAIAWIRENIASYGGDPDYIAITGGSAGGHLTALAALTPERRPSGSPASRTPTPPSRSRSPTTASTTWPARPDSRASRLTRDRFLGPRVFKKRVRRRPGGLRGRQPDPADHARRPRLLRPPRHARHPRRRRPGPAVRRRSCARSRSARSSTPSCPAPSTPSTSSRRSARRTSCAPSTGTCTGTGTSTGASLGVPRDLRKLGTYIRSSDPCRRDILSATLEVCPLPAPTPVSPPACSASSPTNAWTVPASTPCSDGVPGRRESRPGTR